MQSLFTMSLHSIDAMLPLSTQGAHMWKNITRCLNLNGLPAGLI